MKQLRFFALSLCLGTWGCHPEAPKNIDSQEPNIDYPWLPGDLGSTPQKLRAEEVSTFIDKFNFSVSPSADTIFYCATSQKLGFTAPAMQVWNGESFDSPQWLPFAEADIPMADIQISPDGKTLLYSTFKDYPGKVEGFHFDLWSSKFDGEKWGEPAPIKGEIASAGNEFYPILTKSGRLYFNSDINGNSDLYYASFVNGAYTKPVALPDNINSPEREADAFVAPDESFIVFVRVDAEDGFGNSDLYISFRLDAENWSEPVNLGPEINSNQIDGSPWLSPDGQYLVFTTGRQDANLKEEAIQNYQSFKAIVESSRNGSLNYYACRLDIDRYRNPAL